LDISFSGTAGFKMRQLPQLFFGTGEGRGVSNDRNREASGQLVDCDDKDELW
jgi:hypothetical protein